MLMPSEFTPTQWSTAAEKADFGNQLLRFIESGWKQTIFTKKLYTRLSMTYGHIAHFNRAGFYEEWFTNHADRLRFLEHLLRWPCHGQPEFTFCDVEHAVQAEVRRRNLVGKYRLLVEEEERASELRLLASLEQKYRSPENASPAEDAAAIASTPHPPASTGAGLVHQQLTLF